MTEEASADQTIRVADAAITAASATSEMVGRSGVGLKILL